jgi:hypothetical protein
MPMDLLDVLWNSSQDVKIRDVRTDIDRMKVERDLSGWDARELAAENAELKLRLGLLVRLLISKGIINAQEYAALITEAQPRKDDRS